MPWLLARRIGLSDPLSRRTTFVPKHIQLREFLATGSFFGLNGTSTRDDVAMTLGQPDDVGLTSRRFKRPQTWVYGGIELTFGPFSQATLELLHFDCPNLPPSGSASLTVDPWIIGENVSLDRIASACRDAGIALFQRRDSPIIQWETAGGVRLTFSNHSDSCGLIGVSLVFADGR